MSLYRTWRPKSFADLVGQDAVVRTLTHAIESGKLAHAYMFSGPRGSGKTSAAKILARCINCAAGPTAHPDNTCENCVAMIAGTALDVLEIDAASNRGIDEIRALRDAVKFAPSVMRKKVYIIDEAHMLTKEGANAFLKTLEEPPDHAVFILATTEPEKLPVTILSRCQRYAFRRISIPVMIERMREIARFEGIAIDDDALAAIAYRADGGLRDALTMLEQAAAFADGAITTGTIDLAFGATGRNFAGTLIDAVIARDAAEMMRTIESASDAGTDMVVLIRALIAHFRNLLVARIDPALLARDLAPEDAERATERAQSIQQASIVRALRILSDAASLARTGGNPRLELETALLRFVLEDDSVTLSVSKGRSETPPAPPREGSAAPSGRPAAVEKAPAAPKSAPKQNDEPLITNQQVDREPLTVNQQVDELLTVTQEVEEPLTGGQEVAAPPEPSVTLSAPQAQSKGAPEPEPSAPPAPKAAAAGPISVQKVRAAWTNIRGKVESERPPLRAPLSGAMVDAVDGNAVVLKLRSKFDADILKDHLKLLERAIHDVLGAELKVRLETGAAAATQAAPDEPMPQFEESGGDDPDALFNYANERIK